MLLSMSVEGSVSVRGETCALLQVWWCWGEPVPEGENRAQVLSGLWELRDALLQESLQTGV